MQPLLFEALPTILKIGTQRISHGDTFWGPFLEGRGVLDDGGLGQVAVLLSLGERVQALGRQCVRRLGEREKRGAAKKRNQGQENSAAVAS